jgi:diphthine synthase
MLSFVGLGLYDARSVTVVGAERIAAADAVFLELYTSRLPGATVAELEAAHGVAITRVDRTTVESDPAVILDAATAGPTVFLTAGDPMVATTHVDLRLRAIEAGIATEVLHGVSAQTAASGLTGLQNYKFGRAVTLPFPRAGGPVVPPSVQTAIDANTTAGLHTLVFLDIDAPAERYLSADAAAGQLAEAAPERLGVAVARAGSPDPLVRAGPLRSLAAEAYGPPLHMLILPGELHHIEAEALAVLGDHPDLLTR